MSKVTVSFELDLSTNPSLDIKTLKDLRGSLQNLSSLISELHTTHLMKITDAMCCKRDEVFVKALVEACQADAATTAQLFNNYTVSGVTDDGHTFVTNHKEPGYRETMVIDGKEVRDF